MLSCHGADFNVDTRSVAADAAGKTVATAQLDGTSATAAATEGQEGKLNELLPVE